MGNSPCQCFSKKDDTKNLQIVSREKEIKQECNSSLTAEQEQRIRQHLPKIVKLQACYRGHYTRKRIAHLNPELLRSLRESSPSRPIRKKITVVPNYSNAATRATEQRIGPFSYNKPPTDSDNNLEDLEAFELDHGAIYIGQWTKSGLRWGRGVQCWPDGSKYEGYWKHDMANGKGRLIHSDGGVYEGNWVNDKASGRGTYSYNGSQYSGEWRDDVQHGYGVEIWPDGTRYEGNYENGKKHGKGVFTGVDGSVYEGDFRNNSIHGTGIFKWSDGRRYEGEWKNNKMDGRGVFTWSDGRKYVGEYVDDKKHGHGEFIWPDGRRYTGSWINGRQHGRGVYTMPEGSSKEGEWENGRRIRWLDDPIEQDADVRDN
eukprot:TRINITY_DN10583_c0_g5_i1.p1 TRINITY_DN10583_c0_g5~~TRINITY_DN10583_c0_g5_i1.p1  ORF type:complete len:372 (+),score=40.79 TRINITY_DN10583_c0_g5_i1:143-1258(+)